MRIEGSHGSLRLTAHGDHMRLSVPSLKGLRNGAPAERADMMDRALRAVGQRLDIAVGDTVVAKLGAGCRPSRLRRMVGSGPVEIQWGSLLRSVVRR